MSIEADNKDHEIEVEGQNEAVNRKLDAIIFLLEIIADVESGDAIKIVEED